MKILKDTKTSLLLKSFLLNNQDYLSVSVLYYFDLNNPESPLEEQAMLRESSQQLGKVMLDYAMPKPKAEVLLSGSCHNPFPQKGASHVKLKVDSIEKELYVFGQRRWKETFISEPLPFKTMPLDFEHAIAHDDFLPNVEDPKSLTTVQKQTEIAATFLPLDITRKDNMKKLGTHDERWKREQWPGFASDMDYSFFNVASIDQQQDKYFQGGESIEILNMHPEKQRLTSYIPEASFRCFATKIDKNKEELFQEIELHRDTLWLFPEIQRGIVIFRGTLEIADEVYSDVKYLNIKSIFTDSARKSLEEYYELQKKELDRSVEIDQTPLQEADKKIAEAKKEVFDIPRQLKESVQKTEGTRPSLQRTPVEKAKQSAARIDKAIERMEKAKLKLQGLKDDFGHIVKIDVNAFEGAKADLLASKEKIATVLKKADEIEKNSKTMKADALDNIESIKNNNQKIPDELKEKMSFDFLKEKAKEWNDYAFDFLCECVKNLEKEPEEFHKLRHLGLAKRTIPRAWIGFNPQKKILKAREWNLDDDRDVVLPKGLVLARFKEATLQSLRIDGSYVLGSDEEYELFLSEGNENFPLFYFQDDLEAYLCDQEAFDICNSLVTSDISNITEVGQQALEKASVVFYLNEDGVIEKLPNAKKFDCGEYENLIELHQNGLEIREQIIQNLPDDSKDTLPLQRDISVKSIREKSKQITNKAKVDLQKKTQNLKKEMEADRDAVVAEVNKHLKQNNLEPIDFSKKVNSDGFIKASDLEKVFDKATEALKKQDGSNGVDLKEKILEMQKAKEKLLIIVQKGELMYADGLEKIAAAKMKAQELEKTPIPQWAKEMMDKAGIDSQNLNEKLTREKVIELHAKGVSFAMKVLSELDLSGLDLSGIDLSMAICKKTNFSNTNLSNAKLQQLNCEESDFTNANLCSAKMSMCNLKKAILKKTILQDSYLDMTLFDSVKIDGCSLDSAKLDGTIFKEVEIENSTFEHCHFLNVNFLQSSIKGCSFNNSKIEGLLVSESQMSNCYLLYLEASKILFNKSNVKSCDFSRSKLYNMRILKSTILQKCNFTYANMEKTSIIESKLEECSLQHAVLDRSLIKKSTIHSSDFRAVIAKQGRFEYSSFQECSFIGINLFRGSLRRMDLKLCDFSRSNLYGVEMYKTKLYEVNFTGANLKRSNLEGRVDLIGKEND